MTLDKTINVIVGKQYLSEEDVKYNLRNFYQKKEALFRNNKWAFFQ